MSGEDDRKKQSRSGPEVAAEMLSMLEPLMRERLLENVAQRDPVIARDLRDRMIGFADLARLETAELQLLLREVPQAVLPVALRGAPAEVLDAILCSLPKRAGEALIAEIDRQGPTRRADVEVARAKVVDALRKLMTEGKVRGELRSA